MLEGFELTDDLEAPLFPKTPTEKSPFNGNEESGWSLKHGQEKNRHIL